MVSPNPVDGILLIDKPAGCTSHDVVARVRRTLRTKRAGHAGTLDPDATGVLLVAVGQATRLLPFLPIEPKRYVARARFGVATTTEDASGEVVEEADASHLDEGALRAALPAFVGAIHQVPPMVSALHHEGRRLYDLAREGITVERAAREVTIHSLTASDFAPGPRAEVTLDVVCGGGTYIRTLCKDLGAALGLPAHMKSLVREAVGPFRRDAAIALDALTADALRSPEEALGHLASVAIEDEAAEKTRHGMAFAAPQGLFVADDEPIVLLWRERLLALARLEEGRLQPFRVFAQDE